ncbi:Ig-like domain-containing protein [Kitasatospora sp. A2-31]|uniref:Ig-like domain-containing protein n=1 Tax=Kitasatospora sp. A2-31 TaxID=2916414 RepID=UPI001EEA14B7|nr:Ig-like domain-containing protein [Kitasatospora sp. A2-31]MCG6498223.1 Ig-like domain-containing protein [Kitasatospora sp. A2-31]
MPERVMWTAVPHGVVGEDDDRRLRVSVVASPRLTTTDGTSGVLGRFRDLGGTGEQNWPSRLATTTFALELDGTVVADGLKALGQLQPTLWEALFAPETPVRSTPGFHDYAGHRLISYPARALQEQVRRLYTTVALDALDGPPPLTDNGANGLLPVLVACGFSPPPPPDRREPRIALRSAEPDPNAPPAAAPTPTSQTDSVAAFHEFHDRPARPNAPLPSANQLSGLLDFHQCVACLGDYPALMRRLGLIIDLELPAAGIPTASTARRLRVLPRRQAADPTDPTADVSPTTSAVWDGDDFVAAPSPTAPGIPNGLLDLTGPDFDLIDVDVDGAVHKLVNLTLNLQASLSRAAADRPYTAALPTLRSAGFSLVQDGRAHALAARLADQSRNRTTLDGDSPQDVLLGAEQLVRGYRVDVWDSRSETWHSLCARSGTYRFERTGTVLTIDDEGFVQLSAAGVPAQPEHPAVPAVLYLPESLLRWAGWSLVAPRPGLALATGNDPTVDPVRPKNAAVNPLQLQTSFVATARSLPTLRFGVGYRLRARVVDLAGNSRTLAEADDLPALPTTEPGRVYLRYEPVPSPVVVPRAPLPPDTDPGASPDRLVIRSANTDSAHDAVASPDITDRHLAPPRTTVALAEAHGAFDGPDGRVRGDPDTYQMIVTGDAAHLDHDGTVPVAPAEQLVLPYLPDVIARGAALRGLPGTPDDTVGTVDDTGHLRYRPTDFTLDDDHRATATLIGFGHAADWPHVQPFRLVLREGTQPPDWDAQRRTLTVSLPKGTVAQVALSSWLDPADLVLLGVWDWMRRQVDDTAQTLQRPTELEALCEEAGRLAQWAVTGGHWALTPARPLLLVHAVQQPLGRPTIDALVATRAIGGTDTGLEGTIRVHHSSTGRVDLIGTWNEVPDSGTAAPAPTESAADELHLEHGQISSDLPGPITLGGRIVADYDPATGSILTRTGRCPRHRFPDTGHRVVRYRAVASSRFAEHFVRQARTELHGTTTVPLEPAGVAPHSETVRSADGATVYAPVTEGVGDYTMDYGAGTIARTDHGGIPDGQAVHVDFLPPVTRASDDVVVHVPSSARPAAPRVRYVVPAFEWRRQTRTNVMASHRHGCLRVYLDGPWFSSGEGEQLGVLVAPSGVEPPEPLAGYVTRVADDPLRSYDGPRPGTTDLTFTGTLDTGPATPHGPEGLTLDELDPTPANRVHVHAYDVAYDEHRRLWFCDIEMARTGDAPAFEPFVRLALARYQPHSVVEHDPAVAGASRDVKLSRVVLADFVQLPADRSVLVTRGIGAPGRLQVVVSGESYQGTAASVGSASVMVSVQERQPGLADELAWVPAPEAGVDPGAPGPTVPDAVLWCGTVTLPEDRDPADFRLLVEEHDTLPADDPSQPPRLLYADTLGLADLGPARAPADLSVTSSPNPSVYGQPVTITATVRRAGAAPGTEEAASSGHVTFTDGTRRLGRVPLHAGHAVLTATDLTAGTHELRCVFGGTNVLSPGHGTASQFVARAASRVCVTPRLEIHGTTPFRKPPGST